MVTVGYKCVVSFSTFLAERHSRTTQASVTCVSPWRCFNLWNHPLPSRTFPETRKDQIAIFNAEDSGTLGYNNDNTIPARK